MTELLEFSLNTENPESNYNLAKWYENRGHTSAAHTYYLRASERTEDKFFAYQALIRASFCYTIQGSRDGTEKVLLENALTYLPERPEAYYYLSVLYEKKQDWQNCYIYATLGLNCCKSEIESLDIPEFQGDHLLIFQKAISSWWWGKGKESRELFQLLSDEYYDLMDNRHKNLIDDNMNKLGLVKNKTRILKDSNNYDIYLTTEKKSDHIYSSIIEESLEYALNHESHLPEWVLNMEGMSGKKYRTFINKLISLINNPHYLEIGCWTGSTSVSAMHSNEIKATLIDKWAEDFGNPKEEFFSNLNRCGNKNITFINDDFKNIEYPSNKKYNVYLYDGPHTEEDQYNGLLIPFDSLDDEFIFICDDWNWGPAVDGTIKAIEKLKLNVLYSIEIKTTNYLTTEGDNGNHKQFSDWHNGYYIAVCKKPQPIQDESKKEMMQNIPNQPVMPQVNKKRIFDCFRFFNEKELLELRYHILKDHVDKFVILQGTKTQSGNPCELLAKKYIAELNLPQEKFIVVDVELPSNDDDIDTQEEDIIFRQLSGQSNDTYQNSLNARSRERILLDSLLTVVKDQRDSDVFLVSDCDEIIKPEYVNWFTDMVLQCPNQLIKVPLVELQGRANLRAYSSETNQPISTNNVFFICTKKHFDKCTPFRMRFDINNPFEVTYITLDGVRVEECGWHFSWMGDTNRLKLKQKSTSHYADQIESAIISDMSSKELETYIDNWSLESGTNVWGDTRTTLKYYPESNLPKHISEFNNLKNFFLLQNKSYNLSQKIINIVEKFDINGSSFIGKPDGTDKFTSHSYLELYSKILSEYVDKENCSLLEIGCCHGGSLLLWSELLKNWSIVSLDVTDSISSRIKTILSINNNTKTIFKNAYDIEVVNLLSANYSNKFDIIIDDGPHTEESQLECLRLYFPLLKENGTLIIEDIKSISTTEKLKQILKTFSDVNYDATIFDNRHINNVSDDIVFCVKKINNSNKKRKVIDSFMFYNEFDMLKLRLNYLNDVVDHFIICESNYTFSGKPKPYYLDEILNEFPKDIVSKIVRVKFEPDTSQFNFPEEVEFFDPKNDNWIFENQQRDYISKNLLNFSPDDIFMISDTDEIPSKEIINNLSSGDLISNFKYVLRFDWFWYNFITKQHSTMPGTALTTIKYAIEKGSNGIRYERNHYDFIENGGWHFSYFGDVNFIQNKIKMFSHQEYNKEQYRSNTNISDAIKNKKDIFQRPIEFVKYSFIDFPENLQKAIKNAYSPEYYIDEQTNLPIPVLGVPIVNGVHWLKRLIDSVDYPVKELFIVNNNGRDQITDELNEITKINHPFIEKIRVCHLPHNLGVSGSWNLIIKSYLMSPYWIICNNDLAFTPGFLKEMVEKSMNEDVEIVCPPSINYDYVQNGLGSFECFLLKDVVVQKCGLFDENLYPAYCEDCDYLVKIKANNVKLEFVYSPYYHGETQSYETGSQTLKTESSEITQKIHDAHMKNIQYIHDTWGNDWENWENYSNKIIDIKTQSYNINFNRQKYLGF
jgi:beta-1,4-mannosyl-glycoprotein beta-1,4-N-acetylglucosaminyltransferase